MVDDTHSTIGLGDPSEEWIIPITEEKMKLGDALKSMGAADGYLKQSDVPLIIKLTENPNYATARWLGGPVDLFTHDCIHILLGRGMLLKDEAFVIGFTMGSIDKMSKIREKLFLFITRYLYPEGYKFYKEEAQVFKSAVEAAIRMNCADLTKVDFEKFMNLQLKTVRRKLKINKKYLKLAYAIEKAAYEKSPESQRLL
jgi:hypothetical protein